MGSLLDTINEPSDLRKLDREQLPTLAQEIRARMISTVARTGGHLAASLGVVELAIALHYVFDSPTDRIIWDVGHQAYAHKLLTGRRDQFHTLRQAGGISGFPRRRESEHDAFDTGHGSTAIAAGLGLAKARDLQGGDHAVVAVVGDGSMSGGMSFEALNCAGHLNTPLIVILNDNQMSISRNVGALAGYLHRVRLDPHYLRAKSDFEVLVSRLPLGESLIDAVDRFKGGVKHLLLPGMLFEELGFTYLGPIDGHSLPALADTLAQARSSTAPSSSTSSPRRAAATFMPRTTPPSGIAPAPSTSRPASPSAPPAASPSPASSAAPSSSSPRRTRASSPSPPP